MAQEMEVEKMIQKFFSELTQATKHTATGTSGEDVYFWDPFY